VEYDGLDVPSKSVTIIKRGINPSSQALTTATVDYNNPTYQKEHTQNSSVR
jgi:hypothetical protein